MCTVTYLPLSECDFVLTSSRDEQPGRKAASPPKKLMRADKTVICPVDGEKGGTWIATSNAAFTLCLLNGAFEAHPSGQYAISRGKIIHDFFDFEGIEDFFGRYDFSPFEPFTLLIVQSSHRLLLTEARWDGRLLHRSVKDPQAPHIWSSATLYPRQVAVSRENWFSAWQAGHETGSSEKAMRFHLHAGVGDAEIDVRMKRKYVQTVSITSVEKTADRYRMLYHDLLAGREYKYALIF